jgi:folylpolyglutamate synthase/dihydropteroate synthase
VLKDKEYLSMLDALSKKGEVLYVPPESLRALSPRELSSIRPAIPTFSSIPEALSHSMERAEGRLIVVCGSLYLVGGVREELGVLQK